MVSIKISGNQSSQSALVLIHAFPLSSEMYHQVEEIFRAALPSYRIVLVDLPGFGGNSIIDDWTLAEAMNDLHSQLTTLAITSSVVCGVSMGGYAALAYYKQFPNEVSALILSNTKAEADTDEAKANREKLANNVEATGHEVIYNGMMLKLLGKSIQANDPELLHTVKKIIASQPKSAIVAASRAMAKREDSTELLASISIPTLVIAGTEDELIPEQIMKAMSEKIECATYAPMPQHGHLCVVEDPVTWSSFIVSFLNDKNTY